MGETLNSWLSFMRQFHDRNLLLFRVLAGFIIFLMFLAIARGRLDPDFGWHLRTGYYVLSHGIPRRDIYTYTAKNYPWIDHEWGNDVILALLYKLGGYLLAAIFFSLLWTIGLLIVGWKSRLWVLFVAVLAILPYAGIRPIAWSIFFFALCLKVLLSKNLRWRWLLPLIFIFWANVHAGFIAGLALIAYFAFMKRDKVLVLLFFITAGATLINGYGINLYVEIAHTLFDPAIHNQITEWRMFYIPTSSRVFIGLWIIGFIVFAKPRWGRWISLGPLLFLTALSASRNLPLFVIVTVQEINTYITQAIHKIPKKLTKIPRIYLALMTTLFVLAIIYSANIAFFPYQNRYTIYPVQAVAYLKQHPCNGHLFNDYNYGGYIIWKLPNTPVYIDGRMVTWTYYMNRYLTVINNPSRNVPSQFKQYNINCALLGNNNTKLISYLEHTNWRIVIKNNYSVLLER